MTDSDKHLRQAMIVQREAVRAIILTPTYEVLLLRIRLPEVREPSWIAPGGGLEPGEDGVDALRRELREELGLKEFVIGPLVWRRKHTFSWAGKRICQRERYYVVQADRFQPRMADETEIRVLDQFRWWSITELASSVERLTPLSLADIVTRYLTSGPPQEPLEEETLVD